MSQRSHQIIRVVQFSSLVELIATKFTLQRMAGDNIASRSTSDGQGKNASAINGSIESSTGTLVAAATSPIECDEIYDSVLCWPRVIAGTVAKVSCRQAFRAMGLPDPKNSLDAAVTIGTQVIHFQGKHFFFFFGFFFSFYEIRVNYKYIHERTDSLFHCRPLDTG